MGVKFRDTGTITEKRIERFWAKVDKSQECWEWQGCLIHNGYGYVNINYQTWLAHRFAWFLCYGYQSNKFLLHSCDNRKCVNPDHLREGDFLANAQDRVERDRSAKGEKHGRAKLKEAEVIAIRSLYKKGSTFRQLSDIYKVAISTIKDVCYGRNWKYLGC